MVSPQVVYNSKSFLVVDKPSGMVTVRTPGFENTLSNWLEKNVFPSRFFASLSGDFGERCGVVHRLDKDTSGLVLVAKTPIVFSQLQQQFKNRVVEKEYQLLAVGDLPFQGSIAAPIKRAWSGRKFCVFPGGRKAKTDFEVTRKYRLLEGIYSFVKAYPLTGRTHQIRVHLLHLGCPIWGDPLYGGRKTKGERLFLHAANISFLDPEKRERISFSSSLPEQLQKVLKKLDESEKKTGLPKEFTSA